MESPAAREPMIVRRRRLHRLGTIFTAMSACVLVAIAGVALRSIAVSHQSATNAARVDLAALEDATELSALLYQKGFVAEYFLTRNSHFLDELERARPDFERWLVTMTRNAGSSPAVTRATAQLVAEYGRFDAERRRAIAMFTQGRTAAATQLLLDHAARIPRLREIGRQLIRLRRGEVQERLSDADRAWRHALAGLGLALLVALAAAAAAGDLLARRVAQPLYELVLRAQSQAGTGHAWTAAARGARVQVTALDELGALSEHVTRLARRIESSSLALAEQRARLAQAEKLSALGEMATAMAHEILNPLTGVKTALQLLARTHADRDVRATVADVDGEIRRVERMAQRLMRFARPAAPRPARVDLDELLPRVVAAVQPDADAHCAHVELRLNRVRAVTADAELLTQILIDLVANACQASRGTVVRLAARAEPGWRILEVIDSGRGLSPIVARQLFTPFVTDRPEGHGLGLAIAQNLALAHGGRIEAHANTPAPGTTFRVWLPDRAAPAGAVQSAGQPL